MLEVSELSRSTFYYQLKVQALPNKYEELIKQIQLIYHDHKGRYGYRRITAVVRHAGYCVNHKTVQKLMGQLQLKARIRVKKYHSYKGNIGKIADNLLQRQFHADKPHSKWSTDVCEFHVHGDKLYLSPLLDLFNSEVISYRMAKRPMFSTVEDMMSEAISKLSADEKPIVHSDQGWQYQMQPFQQLLKQHDLKQSMSRKGNCLDNCMIENFFGIVKSECFYLQKFESINQLEQALHEYMHYYNHNRIKEKLNWLSPVQYRLQAIKN